MSSRKNYKGLLWGGGLLIALLILFLLVFLVYSFNKFYSNKKTILDKQQILFSKLDIQSVINEDGTIITTDSNISESTFKKLSFVTNNPALNPVPMNLIGISVFLDGSPLLVNGFFEYCRKRIDASDKMAFSLGKEVHQPMLDASVVDQLLGYQVHGIKTFQLVLDPVAKAKTVKQKVSQVARRNIGGGM